MIPRTAYCPTCKVNTLTTNRTRSFCENIIPPVVVPAPSRSIRRAVEVAALMQIVGRDMETKV